MDYLDYPRACDADPALKNFLVSLSREDTIRRAKNAFPEFFTTQKKPFPIGLADIRRRKVLLDLDIEHNELQDDQDLFPVLFDWFSLEFFEFECRATPAENGNYLQLPPDFKLERDESYDPLSDSFDQDLWIVSLPKNEGGSLVDHLVIKVQEVEAIPLDSTKFFLTTLLWSHVY